MPSGGGDGGGLMLFDPVFLLFIDDVVVDDARYRQVGVPVLN